MSKKKEVIIRRLKSWSMLLACMASLLCITPEIVPYSMLGYLKYVWMLPLSAMLIFNPRDFIDRRLTPIYIFTAIMIIYAGVMQLFSPMQYLGMDIYNFIISTGVATISFVYLKNADKAEFFRNLCLLLTAVSVVLSLLIMVRHLTSSDFTAYNSGYEFKNATAFSLCCVLVLIYVRLRSLPNCNLRIYYAVAFTIIAAVIILLRSRATYLCLAFLMISIILNIRNRKFKTSVIICVGMFVAMTILITPLRHLIFDTLILGNRDFSDINLLSSYRLSTFKDILESMPGNWIFGIGSVYLDCFPAKILFEFGIVGALPIIAFILFLGHQTIHFRKMTGNIFATPLFLLYFIAIINCIFEAYPPFGPGLRCFLLWISYSGMLVSIPEKRIIATSSTSTLLANGDV